MLNTGHRFSFADVLRSLVILRLTGLRSVILIGGGEPTLHPRFVDAVKVIKSLGLQCAVVSNGSGNARIHHVANLLGSGDWVRLSLDAGREETFRVMHLPRRGEVSLKAICLSASAIKEANPAISLGFSFIVTWSGATVEGRPIVENLGEMAAAARLARNSGFDFITFKPLLDRDEIGGEAIRLDEDGELDESRLTSRIAKEVAAARALEDERFRVYASPNLVALEDADLLQQSRIQPSHCRMHFFRQVLTPIGIFGCPVYRGNPKDRIGPAVAYATVEDFFRTRRRTAELTEAFDASVECRNISCIYNSTNWWLQAIHDGEVTLAPSSSVQDFFL
jgi:hypothetical protein